MIIIDMKQLTVWHDDSMLKNIISVFVYVNRTAVRYVHSLRLDSPSRGINIENVEVFGSTVPVPVCRSLSPWKSLNYGPIMTRR